MKYFGSLIFIDYENFAMFAMYMEVYGIDF
jgi:hypothetical protein